MNNIRQIITERLENAINDYHTYWDDLDMALSLTYKLEGQIEAYQDCLNLLPAPRTEADILKDFEKLGYKIKNDSEVLRLKNNFIEIYVYKQEMEYGKEDIFSCEANRFTMQEHKLLNELFEVWGW